MTGRTFLSKFKRWIPRHLDFRSEDDRGDAIAEWTGTRAWERDGHRFSGLGSAASGDRWYAWSYPDLSGPPPIVFLGDGNLGVVAGSAEAFVWQLADEEPDDEADTTGQAAFRALVERQLGQRSDPDLRAHPDFLAFLYRYQVPRAPVVVVLPGEPQLAPWMADWRAGLRKEALAGALRWFDANPDGVDYPTAAKLAEWAEQVGDIDRAVQLYDRTENGEAAFRLLGRGKRYAEAEARLHQLDVSLFDPTNDPIFAKLNPVRVREARLVVDRREREWQKSVTLTIGLPARQRRAAMSRFLKEYNRYPLGSATILLEIARAWLEVGDLQKTSENLARARELAVEDVGNSLAELERAVVP